MEKTQSEIATILPPRPQFLDTSEFENVKARLVATNPSKWAEFFTPPSEKSGAHPVLRASIIRCGKEEIVRNRVTDVLP